MCKFVWLWKTDNLATMTSTATSAPTTSTESKAASGGSLVAAVQPGGQHDAGGGDVNREQIYQWWVVILVHFMTIRDWVQIVSMFTASNKNNDNKNKILLYFRIIELSSPDTRETALLELSKKREVVPDLAPMLWHSFGTIAALLQVIFYIIISF